MPHFTWFYLLIESKIVVILLVLSFLFIPVKEDRPPSLSPVGGGLEYKVGGNCPDPKVDYTNIVRDWPLDYFSMSQPFKWSHPANDMVAPAWTPIEAVGFGFVMESTYQAGGYGYYVVIKHSKGIETLYAHMIQAPDVKKGDYVFPGKVIGYVGTTGNSTGYHLHFEILFNGCNIDPHTIIEGY